MCVYRSGAGNLETLYRYAVLSYDNLGLHGVNEGLGAFQPSRDTGCPFPGVCSHSTFQNTELVRWDKGRENLRYGPLMKYYEKLQGGTCKYWEDKAKGPTPVPHEEERETSME